MDLTGRTAGRINKVSVFIAPVIEDKFHHCKCVNNCSVVMVTHCHRPDDICSK